jgi:hypothetical protein
MKFALTLLLLISSLSTFAKQTNEELFMTFCGSRSELSEYARKEGQQVITKGMIAQLIEQRAPVLEILRSGDEGIDRLLEKGSADDIGPFGALMACGIIDQNKTQIKARGCIDLKTNKLIRDNGGIDACSRMIKAVMKRQRY